MIWCIKKIYIIYTLYNEVWNKCGLIYTPLKKDLQFWITTYYNNSPVSVKQMLIYRVAKYFKVNICRHLRPHRGATCYGIRHVFPNSAKLSTDSSVHDSSGTHVSGFTSTINSQACTNQKQGSPSSTLFFFKCILAIPNSFSLLKSALRFNPTVKWLESHYLSDIVESPHHKYCWFKSYNCIPTALQKPFCNKRTEQVLW